MTLAHLARPAVIACALGVACSLPSPGFARPCVVVADCDEGDRCFDGACVPPDFPLLPKVDAGTALDDAGPAPDAGPDVDDAGPDGDDAGPDVDDAGTGEGEGEGEGELLPGERCLNAIPLELGVTVTGSNAGYADDHFDATNCDGGMFAGSPDVVYSVTMPPGLDLHVVAPMPPGPIMFVKVLTSCLDVALAGGCGRSNVGQIDFVVPDPPDGTLFIMVDGFNDDAENTFTLTATAE